MRIYVGHSKKFNYKKELYEPLRESSLNDRHEIVLPHEESDEPFNSKEFLETCDVMIAEVSYPGTGLGIELGWADALGIPIIAARRKDIKLSNSVKSLIDCIITYSTSKELILKIKKELEG